MAHVLWLASMLTADKWIGQSKHALQDLLPSNQLNTLKKMSITNVKLSHIHVYFLKLWPQKRSAVLCENNLQQNVILSWRTTLEK